MGCKFSKAVRPHVKATASVAPTSGHHNIEDTDEQLHQDPSLRLPVRNPTHVLLSCDDISVVTSIAPTMDLQRQRSMSLSTPCNHENRQHLLNSFEQFYVEYQFRAIQYESGETLALPVPSLSSLPPPVVEPVHQVLTCLICCKDLPEEKDSKYVGEAMRPCRSCDSVYCVSCVKNMFIDACKDISRMPPRCCIPINLHQAKALLTAEEMLLFRLRYEEWSTPNPLYCPVPVCSAFISNKLLPQYVRSKDKLRIDSGIGTPISDTFACPTCEANICGECRQPAHPGSICSIHEFGLDAETAALLKSWGYKRCPKCGHGLKRMFGCNHMECRCGAHFCWTCMQDFDKCSGGCYDEDEEDFESDAGSNDEEDNHETSRGPTDVNGTPAAQNQTAEYGTAEAMAQTQPAVQAQNLDGGGARYWANTELDFGEEPTNDIQDRSWYCTHSFDTYTIPFATALTLHTNDMECVKCWGIIHPAIEAPKAIATEKKRRISASTGRVRVFRQRGGRGMGRGRARYVPPRGLFRADATIGTAPHLTTTVSPLFHNVPASQVSPTGDVQFTERVVASYGNTITTTPWQPLRRASLDNVSLQAQKPISFTPNKTITIFTTTPATFSFGHECVDCHIVVCERCKTEEVAMQEAAKKREQERHNQEQQQAVPGVVQEEEGSTQNEPQEFVQEALREDILNDAQSLPNDANATSNEPEPTFFNPSYFD
jgi:hypothetical protein